MKSTCYHARLHNNNTVKVLGGTLSFDSLDAAAESLCARFDIGVSPSGVAHFIHNNKPVRIYLSVDPSLSDKGKAVLTAHRRAKFAEQLAAEAEAGIKDDELNRAIAACGGIEAAIAKLKG